jgi:serine protease
MHRSARLAALIAALSMVVAASGLASAHPSPALSPGTEVLPIFRGVQQANPHKPQRNNNLSSHGGPIQVTPKVYISWWGPEWSGTGFSTGGYTSGQAQTYNIGFFSNVGGSAWNNVVKQYCQNVPSGTQSCSSVSGAVNITNPANQFAAAWNDTTAVPSNPTQTDIFNAAKRLQAHYGALDPEATYMVYTPHGKSMSGFGTQWCAWHSSGSVGSGQLAYAYIPYLPDAGASCGVNFINSNNSYGNGWFDGFSVVAGHEYSEAETDPFPSSGWVDRNGAENADKCAWSASSGNISLGGHNYAVQPTWSNASSGCAMSAS